MSEDNPQSRGPQSRGSKTPSRDGSEDRKGNSQPIVPTFPKPVTPPTSLEESRTANNVPVTPSLGRAIPSKYLFLSAARFQQISDPRIFARLSAFLIIIHNNRGTKWFKAPPTINHRGAPSRSTTILQLSGSTRMPQRTPWPRI